jgi:hypothetical protein
MLRSLFKYALYTLLVIILLVMAVIIYDKYQSVIREKEVAAKKVKELQFGSVGKNYKWKWHNEELGVQVAYLEGLKRTVLRKVNLDQQYAVYAYKDDDYAFNAIASFQTKCEPKTTITTTEKFPNGEAKVLTCSEDGSDLYIEVAWPPKTDVLSLTWEENLNGFRVNESFSGWDFDLLDREVTLKKAEKPIDSKFDLSTAKPVDKK